VEDERRGLPFKVVVDQGRRIIIAHQSDIANLQGKNHSKIPNAAESLTDGKRKID